LEKEFLIPQRLFQYIIPVLGYAPKTDVRTGLKETCEWILGNRDSIEKSFLSPRADLEVEAPAYV
jgi:hypothetical protein